MRCEEIASVIPEETRKTYGQNYKSATLRVYFTVSGAETLNCYYFKDFWEKKSKISYAWRKFLPELMII